MSARPTDGVHLTVEIVEEIHAEAIHGFGGLGGVRDRSLLESAVAALWTASTRDHPARITPPDYPAQVEVRRVSTAGTFRLRPRQPFLSQVLKGEDIGLEEVGDGIWNIVYYRTLLGKIDERTLLLTGV